MGVAKLERVVQDTLQDVMEVINNKDGEPFDTYQLTYGYVCCVMTSIVSYKHNNRLARFQG